MKSRSLFEVLRLARSPEVHLCAAVCLLALTFPLFNATHAQRLGGDQMVIAKKAAVAELKTFLERMLTVPRYSPFGITDRAVLENATLGEPFRYYWPDTTFLQYEIAEPGTLLEHMGNEAFVFPTYSGGQTLGTINVQIHDDNSISITGFVGEGLVTLYQERAKTAPIAAGQRLSVIQTTIGEFAVVEDGTRILAMARLDGRPIDSPGSPPGSGLKWVPVDKVAPSIKAALRQRRESMMEPAVPVPLREIDDDP